MGSIGFRVQGLGLRVDVSSVISPSNMGYNCSYPTYNPTYNYP